MFLRSPDDSEVEDWMDEREDEEDSEMDLLLWISTPTSSDSSSKRRLRYLQIASNINFKPFWSSTDLLTVK